MLKRNQIPEFCGQIIDVFEDFLEERNVMIPNYEKEGDESEAIIYGSDYDIIRNRLDDIIERWNIVEKDENGKDLK